MKQSTITDKRKCVTFWTPVVIGNKFIATIKPRKHEYSMSRAMHHFRIPNACNNIQGGLIIDLPNVDIKSKVDEVIDVSSIESDERLIQYL